MQAVRSFVALGDSFTEGLGDRYEDGSLRGWADRFARELAATSADLEWAEGILRAVGAVVRLPERLLDAVTGLSGSGPAYVYLVAEALIEAGVAAGLSQQVSHELVVGTLVGASRMMAETGAEPAELRAAVTSPGGTTAAGLRILDLKSVRSAFVEAVAAATERARQLGR